MALTHRPVRSFVRFALCLALASGWLVARPAPAAQAANITLYVDIAEDYHSAPGVGYAKCEGADYYSGIPDCSLRGAITLANSDPNNRYTIRLKSGETYMLSLEGAGEDDNATGDLDINTNLTIEGYGAIIDADEIDRVIDFNAPLPGLDINATIIRGLSITGGHAPDGVDGAASLDEKRGEGGGGIRIKNGELHLISVAVAGNQAGAGGKGRDGREGLGGTGGPGTDNEGYPGTGGRGGDGGSGGSGGGIYAGSNTQLLLEHTSIIDNSAGDGGNGGRGGDGSTGDDDTNGGNGGNGGIGGLGGDGGGVFAFNMDVSHSLLFALNVAGKAGNGGAGGDGGYGAPGEYSDGGDGGDGGYSGLQGGRGGGLALLNSANLTNVVFFLNSSGPGGNGGAGGYAGVGRFDGESGESMNGGAAGMGGAILANDVSYLKLSFSTIVVNLTGSHGVGFVPPANQDYGAGISARGPVSIKNSILYFNIADDSQTPDSCQTFYEPIYSGGHNLIESAEDCELEPIAADTPADIFGRDPLLDLGLMPLEPWMTFVGLQSGSPAIDRIPLADCTGWETNGYPGQPVTDDQRKQERPQGLRCDIGAVESPYTRFDPVFLPMVIR